MPTYIPPHMRSKQEQPTMERKNPFQKERRAPRRPYEKPSWKIEEEAAQLEIENKKKEVEKGLENTLENFPSLGGGGGVVSSSIWTGSRKFAELAADWKATDEQRKEDEKLKDEPEFFQLPRFRSIHRFSEPEEEEEEYDEPLPSPSEEDEWRVVDHRKYRKHAKPEFNFDEIEFTEQDEEGEDETVWDQEERETCWDERRR